MIRKCFEFFTYFSDILFKVYREIDLKSVYDKCEVPYPEVVEAADSYSREIKTGLWDRRQAHGLGDFGLSLECF